MSRFGFTTVVAALAGAGAIAPAIASANDSTPQGGPQTDFDHVTCSGAPNEVRVFIEGVADAIGLVRADLYRNDPNGFLKAEGRVRKTSVAAKAPLTQFCMTAPAAGQYAIAVYHDENANLRFDKKAFGMPAEPYGISNNPKIRFAPPKVEEALFSVSDDGTTVVITLND